MSDYQFTINEQEEYSGQNHTGVYLDCVADLKEIIGTYLEEDLLSPGEFMRAMRDALAQESEWHESRQRLLTDAQALLNGTSKKQVLNEEQTNKVNYNSGAWKGDD